MGEPEKAGNIVPFNRHQRRTIAIPADPIAQVQQYACTRCKDRGFVKKNVPYGHPDAGKIFPCSCKVQDIKQKEQEKLVSQSNIMGLERYKKATFETFDVTVRGVRSVHRQAYDYAMEPDGWLVLLGPYGCGKTHLAAAIAKERLKAGNTVLFETVPDLLDRLRSTFSPRSEYDYSSQFDAMKTVDVLILDDYGAENSTGWAEEKLFQLLNYRYNCAIPTVITSNNMTLEGIDPRIYSRLLDQDLVAKIVIEAIDYRPLLKRKEK